MMISTKDTQNKFQEQYFSGSSFIQTKLDMSKMAVGTKRRLDVLVKESIRE